LVKDNCWLLFADLDDFSFYKVLNDTCVYDLKLYKSRAVCSKLG